ncbi:MAG: hypothetical protein O7I42_04145 [Alphaproteobacteria bacterium]|nr:hypothetical protein [Alphaproteobacteria bacterium]
MTSRSKPKPKRQLSPIAKKMARLESVDLELARIVEELIDELLAEATEHGVDAGA